MLKRSLPVLCVLPALFLCGLALTWTRSSGGDVLEATGPHRWMKGNMHTHSFWSDGDNFLESIALWYQDHDYQFLVFTDHNVLANRERWLEINDNEKRQKAYAGLKEHFGDWIDERQNEGKHEVRMRTFTEVAERMNRPGEYLLLPGEEVSDKYERFPIHLNVSNIQEFLAPRGGASVFETIQNNVDAALAQRDLTGQPMLVHLNHPNFGFAIRAEDFIRVQGEKFFEVYGGPPVVKNRGDELHSSTDRFWDVVLSQRLGKLELPVMYGIAVDDSHHYHHSSSGAAEPGRGWVMVLSNELSPAALFEAMEEGRFYASTGVTLSRVEASPTRYAVDVVPVDGETYLIEFIGTRKSADLTGRPVLNDAGEEVHATWLYGDDVGAVLKSVTGTSAEYELQGDELYVRARVTSSALHPNPAEPGEFQRAWAQPVVGSGAPSSVRPR